MVGFDAIPYAENISLRAPFTEAGIWQPLEGKETIRNGWWAPLPSLIGKTTFINSYVNKDATAVTAEFHRDIINPACTLRIIDRFTIYENGMITEQENFLDPIAVRNAEVVA